MKDEQVLERSPLVLDRRSRERYFEDGFLVVPGYVGAAWLDRLRAVVAAKIEESRALSASDDQFDLAPDHSAEKPNIRRLRKAVDQHPELWAFAQDPTVVDLVADLLGPDVPAADTLPMTPAPSPTKRTGVLVRGQEPLHVHMEPYPARLPPRWDQVGYRSIFAAQSAARPVEVG